MKILQVIHDFLPRHQAGSELYCYHISKGLQQKGHSVALFYAETDHARPDYSMRQTSYDGLPAWEVINNHHFRSFQETFSNPAIEALFMECLEAFRPDIVHVHHLLSLSYGLVFLCRQQGIPVVFTLHDYWLSCPRGGGQRFRGEGKVCHDVDETLCARCVSRYAFPTRGVRLLKKLLAPVQGDRDPTLLGLMERGKRTTDDRRFVYRDTCTLENETRRVLIAHPQSNVSIRVPVPDGATLRGWFAMSPSTYDSQASPVRFRICLNGVELFSETLDARTHSADRGWHSFVVQLEGDSRNRQCIEFITSTEGKPNDHCSAMWAEPRIVSDTEPTYQPTLQSRLQQWGEGVIASLQQRRMLRQVEARRQATMRVFDQVDLFIAPSPFLRNKFIEYGLPEEKIVFSDYGIENRGYGVRSRSTRIPVHFTYVGTLVEHKGLHVLVQAFNRLQHGQAHLTIYGALDEFSGYVARVQSIARHPGIRFRGRVENRDIPRVLEEADALVIPSIWFENSPITIHEAFLARVPVITSRFGGMADLVKHEENGLLFEVGDVDSLACQLQRCVDDPELLDRCRPDPASVKRMDADVYWLEERYRELTQQAVRVG